MKKSVLLVFLTVIFFVTQAHADTNTTTESDTVTPVSRRPIDRRPSFWSKTANQLKSSTYSRLHKPFVNRTALQQKYLQENGIKPVTPTIIEDKPRRRRIKPRTEVEKSKAEDLEDKIMKDESFKGLKEFAEGLINETTKYFSKRKNPLLRSYPMEDPQPPPQLWDDKDQTYHASSFTNAEYEPTSFHHHYLPPPPPTTPIHFLPPPQKKDDALFIKVALIALLKLILAKLKAIGILKLMTFFLLKLPVMFLKFLFFLKSFKVIKLFSIPFLISSFAAPFLPFLPFFIPVLLFPLLLLPLLLPLMLPLLFFLPIVPVTTPVTATASTRTKRDVNPEKWSLMDDKWMKYQTNGTANRSRYFRTRGRPATFENKKFESKNDVDSTFTKLNRLNMYDDPEESTDLIELTQRVVESQHCLERVACELAIQNDSKIYHAAINWALEKVQSLAPENIKRKIEKYSIAYEAGSRRNSSEFCQQRFFCQRPKLYIVQGKSKYNIF